MKIFILEKVEKVLKKETAEIKEDVQDILNKLENGIEVRMPHIRPLYGIHPGLCEIRVKDRGGQFRVMYYIKRGDAIFLLHAFRKKTEETPKKEIATTLLRLKEILR